MRNITLIGFIFLALTAGVVSAGQPQEARTLVMELVWIPETGAQIFVVGGVGFNSVATLKEFLGQQPAGTIVRWDPGCERIGGEPLLSSEKELDEFRKYLEAKGITFVLVPSG
jgi:hypothetical protein